MAMHGINIAEVPFCETMERRSDEHVWVVDLHVKVARKTEFDISAVGLTLAEALRRAYLSLSHEPLRT
jgi:DNA-directed RNA polymerase alpha subunit